MLLLLSAPQRSCLSHSRRREGERETTNGSTDRGREREREREERENEASAVLHARAPPLGDLSQMTDRPSRERRDTYRVRGRKISSVVSYVTDSILLSSSASSLSLSLSLSLDGIE